MLLLQDLNEENVGTAITLFEKLSPKFFIRLLVNFVSVFISVCDKTLVEIAVIKTAKKIFIFIFYFFYFNLFYQNHFFNICKTISIKSVKIYSRRQH